MPSKRRQKAKERRSRQLDIMSDVENVDVMLGSYSRCDEENNISENEGNLDSGSSRPQQSSNVIGEDFRSLLNTNSRENSEITIETTSLINEEISNQMSRKLNEVKTSLSSQVQEAITAAITNTVLPAIQNTLETQRRLDFTMVDRGSNGPHLSPKPTDFTVRDRRSSGLQRNAEVGNAQKSWENRPRTCFTQEYTRLRSRESSTDSYNSEQNRDKVTGANPTPHMVPEFLTGLPMQSREPMQSQHSNNNESQDTIPQVSETTAPTTGSDPINRLAEVLVGMNNRPSAQTLMVRPVSSTTLTFDGKSEKFELFEDLFHTMIKMQPDMTETIKINHFHSLLQKNALQTFRNINTANSQTLEEILAVFRRKYVKPESQATAKHKWHRLVFDPNTMKLPDFLEELNQGAEKAFGENAQAMIDSLLYAKLPPKLKRSVNMARLENATYEEIVTHLERELELMGLEEGDDIPVPTMSTAPTATRPGTGLLSSGIDANITCNYCKKPGHVKDDCRKLKRKEEQRRNDGQDTKKEYPKCPTCDKTNHPAERCWKGAGAHLSPKNLKLEDFKTDDPSTSNNDAQNKQTTSILKNPKN